MRQVVFGQITLVETNAIIKKKKERKKVVVSLIWHSHEQNG